MAKHAVVIAGGGSTGLMLAGELALAGVDVAMVERRASQDLVGSRAGGLQARAIKVLDQRGIAGQFISRGQVFPVVRWHHMVRTAGFGVAHRRPHTAELAGSRLAVPWGHDGVTPSPAGSGAKGLVSGSFRPPAGAVVSNR